MICPSCQAPNNEKAQTCARCGEGLRAFALGTLLSGRYEVLELLGKGGMGVVYKAHDRELDEMVALKVLRGESSGLADAEKRFRSEIKLARKVRHRNVCGIHEYGRDGPLQYIAMEFVSGVDLRRVIEGRGGLLPAEAFNVAVQVANGLQAIHAEGIVHRDLKTANLMQDRQGVVRLMDFGIAKRFEGESTRLTGTGFSVGTPEYMSPEQVRGEAVDARSDIYALGIVVFELFTGRLPFHGDTPVATMYKQLQEPPPLDGPLAVHLPPALIPLLARALAKERNERFSSAAQMAQALRAARTQTLPEMSSGPRQVALPVPDVDADTGVPPVTRQPLTAGPATGPTTLRPRTRPTPQPTEWPDGANAVVATGTRPVRVPRVAPTPSRFLALAVLVVLAVAGLVFLRRGAPSAREVEPMVAPPTRALATQAPLPRTPAPAPPSAPAAASPRSASDLAGQLDALDKVFEEDPERAFTQASKLALQPASEDLRSRVIRYRQAAVERRVSAGQHALKRAAAGGSRDVYGEALRDFQRALQIEPTHAAAQKGRAEAAKALEGASPAAGRAVTFVQGETTFTAPATAAPPGLGPAPAGVVIRPAQAPAPKAQLVIEVTPPRVQPAEPFRIRYWLFNRSGAPLRIGSTSVHNVVGGGGVTGGGVEPLSRSAAPQTRTLLLETSHTWTYDATNEWDTTLTVVLDDGSIYKSTLQARR